MISKIRSSITAAAVLLLLAMFSSANAQTWEFTVSEEQGVAGSTVEVRLTIDHVGDEEAWRTDIQVSDLSVFSNVDFSQCTSEFPPAFIETCGFRAPPNDDVIRVQWSSAAAGDSWPASADAIFLFTIDDAAAAETVVDLEFVPGETLANGTFTTNDGSITVLDVPPEELSELSVTPDPLDFGTVDLGNMPQTGDITATNTGGSESSLTIASATYSGDAEFSVASDGCTGATLEAGESCVVTIEFDAASDGSFSGQLDFSSDADSNPNPSVDIQGSADSVAALSIDPPSGAVNLGSGFPGDTVSTSGSVSNTGSADGDFDCNLDDVSGVFSTDPSPLAGTVPAGDSFGFTLSCTLPGDAEDGDSFSATLSCSGAEGFSSTHDLSCSVSEFEPLPVPTMQKWSLILFALLMLAVGGFSIRFFRAS